MEGSIHNVLADRMKNRGMSWSIKGAEHMAKLLSLKHSKELYSTLERILKREFTIGQEIAKEITDEYYIHEMKSIKEARKQPKASTNIYPIKTSKIPYSDAKQTPSRKVFKQILGYRSLEDLKLAF